MEPENKPIDDIKITHDRTEKPKVVKTFMDDVTHELEDGKDGIIKKIIHSEEQSEEEKINQSPQSRKNKLFLFFGIFLFLVSLGALIFFFKNREVPSVPVDKQFVPIIFTDKNVLVELANLKKEEIGDSVFKEVKEVAIKPREIQGIYPTLNKAPVYLKNFISIIEGGPVLTPENFVDDNFLMGVVKNDNKTNSFFILMKMRSISDVFSAMREWETKMFLDLYRFFGISLSQDTKYLLNKGFENGIVENKNARVLYDNENKVVMMYVYPNDNYIIITNSENAVREIMFRLSSSEVKQ